MSAWSLAAFGALLLVAGGAVALTNGDFEDGLEGWSAYLCSPGPGCDGPSTALSGSAYGATWWREALPEAGHSGDGLHFGCASPNGYNPPSAGHHSNCVVGLHQDIPLSTVTMRVRIVDDAGGYEDQLDLWVKAQPIGGGDALAYVFGANPMPSRASTEFLRFEGLDEDVWYQRCLDLPADLAALNDGPVPATVRLRFYAVTNVATLEAHIDDVEAVENCDGVPTLPPPPDAPPPVLACPSFGQAFVSLRLEEGQERSVAITTVDPDDRGYLVSVSSGNVGLSWTSGTERLSMDAADVAPGTYQAVLTLEGPDDCEEDTLPVTIEVTAYVPPCPSLGHLGPFSLERGLKGDWNIPLDDPRGTASLALDAGAPWALEGSPPRLAFDAVDASPGDHTVRITASDTSGLCAAVTIDVDVTVLAPVCPGLAPAPEVFDAAVRVLWVHTFTITEPQQLHVLHFEAPDSAARSGIVPDQPRVSWFPGPDDVGEHPGFRLTLDPVHPGCDRRSVTWTVVVAEGAMPGVVADREPTCGHFVRTPERLTATVGEPLRFRFEPATQADEVLSVSSARLPPGVAVDTVLGSISWTPTVRDLGSHEGLQLQLWAGAQPCGAPHTFAIDVLPPLPACPRVAAEPVTIAAAEGRLQHAWPLGDPDDQTRQAVLEDGPPLDLTWNRTHVRLEGVVPEDGPLEGAWSLQGPAHCPALHVPFEVRHPAAPGTPGASAAVVLPGGTPSAAPPSSAGAVLAAADERPGWWAWALGAVAALVLLGAGHRWRTRRS